MSITNLVELQEIDSQLEDLNSLLGDLPKMVEELNEQESRLLAKLK
jgi:predicted  nucleic acid-binding Zn-ribbon protein